MIYTIFGKSKVFFRNEKKKRRESVVRAGGCPYVADPREKGRKEEEQIEGEGKE